MLFARVFVCAFLVAAATAVFTDENGIGNTVVNGLSKPSSPPPSTLGNWGYTVNGGACDPMLGILYNQDENGPSPDHPLSAYYTADGKIAGLQVTIYGKGDGLIQGDVGDAAQPNLVNKGFWNPSQTESETWTMSVSFRAPGEMCGTSSDLVIGDRLVINQDTIAWSVPLRRADALAKNFQAGSCLNEMGQHYMLDLSTSDDSFSWEGSNLMPVIPMYYVDGPKDGHIHAFFFATPVMQHGSSLSGNKGWDAIPIPAKAMCLNWCNYQCTWKNTNIWSTMHNFLYTDYTTFKCPPVDGKNGLIGGRTCPSGEIGTDNSWFVADGDNDTTTDNTNNSSNKYLVAFLVVGMSGFVAAVAVAVVMNMRLRRARATIDEMNEARSQSL